MPTGTRLKTAAIGLPLVVGALTTVWGTAILVLLVLVVAMVEYQALINGIICNADKTRGPVTTRLSLAMLLTVSIALFGAATVWDGIADGKKRNERELSSACFSYDVPNSCIPN